VNLAPEVLFALTDDFADQGAGAALEVCALVDEVVAVLDELLDGLLLGHELGDHGPRLVVAHPLTVAIGVGLQVFPLAFGKDVETGHVFTSLIAPGILRNRVKGSRGEGATRRT
jgi:hypothetical protein